MHVEAAPLRETPFKCYHTAKEGLSAFFPTGSFVQLWGIISKLWTTQALFVQQGKHIQLARTCVPKKEPTCFCEKLVVRTEGLLNVHFFENQPHFI